MAGDHFIFDSAPIHQKPFSNSASFKSRACAIRCSVLNVGSNLPFSMAETDSRVNSAWSARTCWVQRRSVRRLRMRPPNALQSAVPIP